MVRSRSEAWPYPVTATSSGRGRRHGRHQLLRKLVAIHQRQAQIEKGDVGMEVSRRLERGGTIERHTCVMADRLEGFRGQPRGVDVVIDDQDAAAGADREQARAPAPDVLADALVDASDDRGKRMTNSLPFPRPSLCAWIVPPCSSTRLARSSTRAQARRARDPAPAAPA